MKSFIYILIFNFFEIYCKEKLSLNHKRQLMETFLSEKNNVSTKRNSDYPNTEKAYEEDKSNEDNKTEDEYLIHTNKTLNFKRIKLPDVKVMKIGLEKTVELPGNVEVTMRVISLNPFIFEIENFIDEEECELLIDLAKVKSLKEVNQKFNNIEFKNANEVFKEWDYNQDGFIEPDEVTLLPCFADIIFTSQDADDMFFVLKMDPNGDGKVDLSEMKKTDFAQAKYYLDNIKKEKFRQRNVTTSTSWIWHDQDELLKHTKEGYFEKYHERISMITGLPSLIIEESEPIQVRLFGEGQFYTLRHDSEPVSKDIPCCLYGDNKLCRFCRYISFTVFLNDVEKGGELVFPLANHKYQTITHNSGEWRGYYQYAKTTGNRFFFSVDIKFMKDGANWIFQGNGKDESGGFTFNNSIILGETIKFEKSYNDGSNSIIKYHGKVIEATKISGNWWVPGENRLHGIFFMWNKEYEIFSARAIDEANKKEGCPNSSVVIQPKKGKAVFWYNHHVNKKNGMVGDINQESMSAHCEVLKGEKWTASSWINVIGDGDLFQRAWRRGNNMLLDKKQRSILLSTMGTQEDKLNHEPYENEFHRDMAERGNKTASADYNAGYKFYEHKPASNSLQALQLLFNDMDSNQLALIAKAVHAKLGLTCVNIDSKFSL
ncbi:uncharacterized protein LOC100206310 isoform X3 [Hydra vulgaris]|uniref:Uncharacterized protein LOC100206310 isoform X3 n=1 Tax=Hydra vulgaris TaxID=6087 RepID=A0ABM4C6K2_HYDVU